MPGMQRNYCFVQLWMSCIVWDKAPQQQAEEMQRGNEHDQEYAEGQSSGLKNRLLGR